MTLVEFIGMGKDVIAIALAVLSAITCVGNYLVFKYRVKQLEEQRASADQKLADLTNSHIQIETQVNIQMQNFNESMTSIKNSIDAMTLREIEDAKRRGAND